MKTLTQDSVSLYIFEDDMPVAFGANSTIVGSPEELIINDCNISNAVMHTDVTIPDAYTGGKYTYDGTTWSANPEYVEPPETNNP